MNKSGKMTMEQHQSPACQWLAPTVSNINKSLQIHNQLSAHPTHCGGVAQWLAAFVA